MRRFLKILFALVLLVIVAAVAAIFLMPRDKIVALAADQVRAATGRELVLSGDISPSFWPVLGVRTGEVRLSNADWASAPDMVSASAAEIGVELVPLFSGEIRVTTLRLVDPVVALEIGKDGRPNWEFDTGPTSAGAGTGGAGGLPKIALPVASISNGAISFRDGRTGQRIELTALDLKAGLAGMDAPLTLDGAGLWNGKRAEFSALVDTPAAAMSGQRTAVRLSLSADPAKLEFDGDLQLAEGAALPLVNGKLSADVPDPSAAILWGTGAAAPAGLGDVGAVKLDGDVAASDAAMSLSAKGSAGYKGRSVGFDVKAEGGKGWLDKQAFTVAVAARADGLFDLSFSGPVAGGGKPSAEGPLKVTVSDLRGLAEWASGAKLVAPDGTLQSASIDTTLAFKGDRLDLSALTAKVDQTSLTGEAAVALGGARPMVTAMLATGPLDLTPFTGGEGGGGTAAPADGWSTEPLDLSALRAVDADVAIRAEAVDLGDIEIGRSDIAARLRDGRMDMTIARVDAYGGGMNGTVALVAGDEAQVAADITVSQVQLRPLLNALAGVDNLEGVGAFRIKAQGRGRSVDALMRSLNGNGGLELTDGAILGLNLAEVVRNLTGQGGGQQKTDFSAITGTFDITDGVVHNSDFSFLGPLIRVVGAGTVDLGNRRQDFRLEPKAVASLTGQGGTLQDTGLGIFPVLVTGTWAKPVFKPDLTAAITGLMANPQGAADAVSGLVKNADPGQAAGALIGALTGGTAGGTAGDATTGTEAQSPANALGGVIGGLLGGTPAPDASTGGTGTGGTGTGTAQPSGLGGLLGALGGATGGTAGGTAGGDATVTQPTFGGASDQTATPEQTGGGDLAPLESPLPRPAPPDRAERAAAMDLSGTGGAEPQQQPAAEPEPQGGGVLKIDPKKEGKKLLDGLLNVLPK